MLFAEFEAAPDIRIWVDSYWHFRVAPQAGALEHWVPPDGGLSLAYDPVSGRFGLSGPWLAPYKPPIHPGMLLWGIRFWPGAGQSLLNIAPGATRDRFLQATELLTEGQIRSLAKSIQGAGGGAEEASAQEEQRVIALGFDAWCRTLAAGSTAPDNVIMTVIFRLIRSGGRERILDIAEGVSLSPRQLRRRFQQFVGLSPKEFARIRRFRASAVDAVGGSEAWASLAAEHGYADQAHLVHEYRRLIGLSPKAFQDQFAKIRHRLKKS